MIYLGHPSPKRAISKKKSGVFVYYRYFDCPYYRDLTLSFSIKLSRFCDEMQSFPVWGLCKNDSLITNDSMEKKSNNTKYVIRFCACVVYYFYKILVKLTIFWKKCTFIFDFKLTFVWLNKNSLHTIVCVRTMVLSRYIYIYIYIWWLRK
jgi:hypothetical protein